MRNLSLICYHFWNKLNLNYLTQIKKQSSLLTDYDLLLHLRHFVNYYLFISVYVLTIHKMTLISNLTVSLVFGDKVNESFASIDVGLYCIYILFLWHGEITISKIRTKRRPRTFVGVRYPSYRWGPRPMWPGTIYVGLETRNPFIVGTRNPGPWKWDAILRTFVICRTPDQKTHIRNQKLKP